jgi:uncharacterized membrane protein YphA (DoxX/SURF4 family)
MRFLKDLAIMILIAICLAIASGLTATLFDVPFIEGQVIVLMTFLTMHIYHNIFRRNQKGNDERSE